MATNFSNNNISAIKIQDNLYNIRTIPFHGTEAEWNSLNYIPKNGEIIIVNLEDGGVRFKIGDGVKTYAQLPFEDEAIRNLIDTKSAVTLETWNNADNADSSITIGNLTINKIKSKEIYDAMKAAGKVDENELYLVEDDNFLPIEITTSLATGIEIGTIAVNGNTYTLYAPDSFALPVATEDILGGIKSGGDITINDNGIVSVNKASIENDGLMSSDDKIKLDGIAAGAEVNVQADWNENDTTSDAYINNRTHWVEIGDFGIVSENVILRCNSTQAYLEGGSPEIENLNLKTGDRMVLTLSCNDFDDLVIDVTLTWLDGYYHPMGRNVPFFGGGDLSYFGYGDSNNYPYSIAYEPVSSDNPEDGGYFFIYFIKDILPYTTFDIIHTKIECNISIYHKIDKHFIPEQNIVSFKRNGLMTSVDKVKLDKIPNPETIITNTNIFDSILMKDQVNDLNYVVCMRNGNLVSYSKAVGITLVTPPNKLTYIPGEYLDPTGMIINVVREDGSVEEVTNYVCNNYVTEKNKAFTIIYTESNIEYTLTIDVTVTEFDETILQDFIYEKQDDGTYLIIGWKGTVNGVESPTEMIVPDHPLIVI